MKQLLTTLSITCLALVPNIAKADAFCGMFVNGSDAADTLGDRAVGRDACKQVYTDFFWKSYDFDRQDWDEGFGYDDPCNVDLPLARTMNSLFVLNYAPDDPPTSTDDYGGNFLRWAGNYTINNIDELDGRCGSGDAAVTQAGPFIDNWTQLNVPFFVENVVVRAGEIVHEARHADCFFSCHWHDGDGGGHDQCPRHRSCDHTWATNGANTWDVFWYWWFTVEAHKYSLGFRQMAADRGNNDITRAFDIQPDIVIPDVCSQDGGSCRALPCCDGTTCNGAHICEGPKICEAGETVCGRECCPSGQACLDGACCNLTDCGGHCCLGACVNGSCCYGTECNGSCCPSPRSCCGDQCCDGTCISGSQCCPSYRQACGNVCCDAGLRCTDPSTSTCQRCPDGTTGVLDAISGETVCCAPGVIACGGVCCGANDISCCGPPAGACAPSWSGCVR